MATGSLVGRRSTDYENFSVGDLAGMVIDIHCSTALLQ